MSDAITLQRPLQIDEFLFTDHCEQNDGLCLNCKEWSTGGVEPDASGYLCEICGAARVIGAEDALMEGLIVFNHDDDG